MPIGVERAAFAIGAMRYIDIDDLALEQAKILALKLLRDTIEISVEGIGGRVQMGSVEASGLQILEPADMRGLHDAVDVWESQCAELLLGTDEPPSASDTPDRGVRPPG
jgi:hypothetical protein